MELLLKSDITEEEMKEPTPGEKLEVGFEEMIRFLRAVAESHTKKGPDEGNLKLVKGKK